MSEILHLTTPLFMLMALGFAAVRSGLFSADQVGVLGRFVLYIALPALIVRAFTQRSLSEWFDPNYLLAVGCGGLAVFAVCAIAATATGQSRQVVAMTALGVSTSNSGYIGYPLAALVIGPGAAVALALNMLVENLVMIPLGLAWAESAGSRGQGWRAALTETLARLVRSPLILAIAAGVVVSLVGFKPPAAMARGIDMLAMGAAPVALFAVGGMLHGTQVRGLAAPVALIVCGKLVLHPLAVAGALQVFPVVDPQLATAAVLMASVPMIAIFPVLGQRFGVERVCAAALLASVLASVVTVNLVLALLRP